MNQMNQYKRGAPYVGDDIADFTHNNKTHHNTSKMPSTLSGLRTMPICPTVSYSCRSLRSLQYQ